MSRKPLRRPIPDLLSGPDPLSDEACESLISYATEDEFAELLAVELVTSDEREWIRDLLVRKADAREAAVINLDPSRAASIETELERYKSAAQLLSTTSRGCVVDDLDALLRAWAMN